jgi:2-oxoglutarate dehydrogenase E1 component
VARREELGLEDKIALIRLEQIAPFPDKVLGEELARYSKEVEVVWCQEEPRNMGAWFFTAPLIEEVLVDVGMRQTRPWYAGRAPSASTASGLHQQHMREQAALMEAALTGDRPVAAGTA